MIAIIDYGMGNIHSVNKALGLFGAETVVTSKKEEIEASEKIVLPGVGAFEDAMRELEAQGLTRVLQDQIRKGKPFIGICLGLQLLFKESQESPGVKGLGAIEGTVKKIPQEAGKVPHMGWNRIAAARQGCPLLSGMTDDPFVYFCHSYYACPDDQKLVAATTQYGRALAAVVWKDNLFGVQFHPEKSQDAGLKIISNFVNAC